MTASWSHRIMQRSEVTNDPIQGEFFNTDGVKNRAGALIRESGQNTQDAPIGSPIEFPPRLELSLTTLKPLSESKALARWFDGIWLHQMAPGNGLSSSPEQTEAMRVLLVEDFNTHGLRGDINHEDTAVGSKNDFCQFFRICGRSGKGKDSLGSWGIGRTVFPSTGRANCFFAFSSREGSPASVLMGLSILKTHNLEDNTRRFPYGYYGEHASDGFCLPVIAESELAQFRADFGLKRQSETGLSVVIPWVDPEITGDELIDNAIREYALPILQGRFVVVVREGEIETRIDKHSLDGLLAARSERIGAEMLPLLRLARCGLGALEENRVLLAESTSLKPPEWSESLFPGGRLMALREQFSRGEAVILRVPVTIQKKLGDRQSSYFDVFIERDLNGSSVRPMFVREGLIVSRVECPRPKGIRAVVNSEAGPLAAFLRDSENPAHTEWKENGEKFRGKYEYGPTWLRFVRQSVDRIAMVLAGDPEKEDRETFKSEFSLPQDQPGLRKRRRVKKVKPGPDTPDLPVVVVPLRESGLSVSQVDGGFVVRRGNLSKPLPKRISIRAAYDVRKGNAFDQWRKPDFQFDRDVSFAVSGCKIETSDGNRAVVSPEREEFEVFVLGFDADRDLKVDVREMESENE